MDIKWHNVCCWLIGNCRDEPLTQRRKSYNRGKGKIQYKKLSIQPLSALTQLSGHGNGILLLKNLAVAISKGSPLVSRPIPWNNFRQNTAAVQ